MIEAAAVTRSMPLPPGSIRMRARAGATAAARGNGAVSGATYLLPGRTKYINLAWKNKCGAQPADIS
jgi:hypothetical protein